MSPVKYEVEFYTSKGDNLLDLFLSSGVRGRHLLWSHRKRQTQSVDPENSS
jgi:hypothetical protein